MEMIHVLLLIVLSLSDFSSSNDEEPGNIARAGVFFPDVRHLEQNVDLNDFIFGDFRAYERTLPVSHEFSDAESEILFYDKANNVVKKVAITQMTRKEMRQVMAEHGFTQLTRSHEEL